jgi:hypothetical protein
MYEVEGTHAACLGCGALLHLPWIGGSSVDVVATGLGARLREGCSLCGGYLRLVTLDECEACWEVWDDDRATGWASPLSVSVLQ